MLYTSRKWISGRSSGIAARVEPLEPRQLFAAGIEVSSELAPTIFDGDNTPSDSEGTDFGTAFVGGLLPLRTFKVTNTSNTDDLELGALNVPAGFEVLKSLPDVLGPGGSTFFSIGLLGTEQTTRSGAVQFTTNVSGAETFNFDVTGTLAPAAAPEDNLFEDVPSFTDTDTVQRAEGEDDEGIPFRQRTDRLLRFNVPAGQASAQFNLSTTRNGIGATGDAELLVLRDTDGDALLDLDELQQPVLSLAATGDQPVMTTKALGAGRYFGLLQVANFAPENPAPPMPGVSIDYTLTANLTAVQPPDVKVAAGDAIVGDGDATPSAADGTQFPSAIVGAAAPQQTFTVTNTGGETLTLGAVNVTGGFELVSGLPASLAPGASATFTARMPTASAGAKTGAVSFATNVSSKNPYNFALAGTVIPNTPEVVVELQGGGALADGQAAVDFGAAVAGQAGPTRTFVVRNAGGGALNLGAVSLPAGFELTEALTATLAPGASDTFTVALASTGDAGPRTGTMSFATNDADENPFDLPLAGTVASAGSAPAPEIALALDDGAALADGQPGAVAFPASVQGGPGSFRTFTVRNDGTAPLALGAVTVPAGFVLTEPLVTELAPGTFDTFTVAVSTATTGARGGNIVIDNSDSDENPFEVPVSGTVGQASATGSAEITVLRDGEPLTSGQAVDFGAATVGDAAPERTLAIRNDGDAPLTLGQVTLPAGYTLAQAPASSTLAAGASTTIRVALSTASVGTFNGGASVASSDADENPFLLTLTGSVNAPANPPPVVVGGVSAKVPAVVIAGDRKARGAVAFTVTNASTATPFAAPVTFSVAASSDSLPGPADTPLITVTRNVKLKAGASKVVKLKVVFPPNTPEGNKTLLVSAVVNGARDDVAGPTISVQEPFVLLTGLPSTPQAPFGRPVTYDRPVSFSVPLQNAGNVPTSKTPATYDLIVSNDGTEAGKVFQTQAVGRISLKAGTSKPQKLTVTFPGRATFPQGTYTLIVKLASAALNQTNGQPVALIPFTIA
jgi:hypothetical protein